MPASAAHYLALGDSISIDDYTGVAGGGAASQLARLLKVSRFQDLTRDGQITAGVLADLERIEGQPGVITLTAGGNDLLMGEDPAAILERLRRIAVGLDTLQGRVVLNTVYDPTDGDDSLAREAGLDPDLRSKHRMLNTGIRAIARERGFMLADLEALFHGHGVASNDPWYVMVIEPNHAGATAIAAHWHELLTS